MTEYTFRIWFSGLCHFVPNRDLSARCQLCVVLPKTPAAEAECIHSGRVHTVGRRLECGQVRIEPRKELLDLEGQRVTFRITRADDIVPPFPFEPVIPAGVIDLELIAGPFIDENDQVVSPYPSPDIVLAQILLENGYRSDYIDGASVVREWNLPSTLSGIPTKIEVADPVYVEFPGVSKVVMISKRLDDYGTECPDGEECETPLCTTDGRTIEILISNRCFDKDGKNPRRLSSDDVECRRTEHGFEIVQIDRDFAFNYQMLNSSTLTSLAKFLPSVPYPGSARLPVPESPLLSVSSALPFCIDTILANLKKLLADEPEAGESGAKGKKPAWVLAFVLQLLELLQKFISAGRLNRFLAQVKSLLTSDERQAGAESTTSNKKAAAIMDLKHDLADLLLSLVQTGVGTGSGSDCLGASGRSRFVDLDFFMPRPVPPAVAASMPSDASRPATSGAQASPASAAATRVIRTKKASVLGPKGPVA